MGLQLASSEPGADSRGPARLPARRDQAPATVAGKHDLRKAIGLPAQMHLTDFLPGLKPGLWVARALCFEQPGLHIRGLSIPRVDTIGLAGTGL